MKLKINFQVKIKLQVKKMNFQIAIHDSNFGVLVFF